MCRWDMIQNDKQGIGHIMKETRWMISSPVLARILEGKCPNKDPHGIWRRPIICQGGSRTVGAQEYPPKLASANLRGLKQQLKLDRKDAFSLEAGPHCR